MSGSEHRPDDTGFTCIWRCGVCITVCAEDALSRVSDTFTVDKNACSRCLMCVKTCPAGIIEEDLFA